MRVRGDGAPGAPRGRGRRGGGRDDVLGALLGAGAGLLELRGLLRRRGDVGAGSARLGALGAVLGDLGGDLDGGSGL